jgi:hypothetical protein
MVNDSLAGNDGSGNPVSNQTSSNESLKQRLLAGKTSLLKIEFAAHFGSDEARGFLGESCPVTFHLPDFENIIDASECAAGLGRFGKEICARIALAVCRVVMRDIGAYGNVAEASKRAIEIIENYIRGNHDGAVQDMRALMTEDNIVELVLESEGNREEEDAFFSILGGVSVIIEESLVDDDLRKLVSFQPQHFHFDFIDLMRREVVPWALGVSE